jgi:hypothetical protein
MQKYKLKFAKQKYKLIYFTRILRKYNIIANITLAKYNIKIKENIKVLRV